MTPTPHFSSHAEQIQALGCAAMLDPKKHPRRFEQQRARERFERERRRPMDFTKEGLQRAAEDRRRELADRASKLSHMTIAEAARVLGVTYSRVQKIKREFGLSFSDSVPKNREAEICQAAECHSTYNEVAAATGLTRAYVLRVLHKHGIFLRLKEEDTAALVERAKAMAGIGVDQKTAARRLVITQDRMREISEQFGIQFGAEQ